MTDALPPLVVIGASAGAVQALLTLLEPLPPTERFAVLITVHVPPDRSNSLVPLLAARCALPVKEAEDKEAIRPGVVYFAPSDYHLLVEQDGHLALSSDELVNYARPAIDVLFDSAADAGAPSLTGIILTGANEDGAAGLAAIVRAGGEALVEAPVSAYARTMPEAALAACPQAAVLDLVGIAQHLQERAR
ncbi:chemotaxis protein CheB [Brevundimonas sp.]|jgi:two-component system chemotaxis response regulator CheB|uniref:chemotaxis protein CheB n=1 Tax=Brevundimonas sp. TaxID=1871086 RepID=UPI0037C01AC2